MIMSLANERQAVLRIIGNVPEGVGWHGIAVRLERQGIRVQFNLMELLRNLETEGFIVHREADGYPHGIYLLTETGRDQFGKQM